MENQNKHVYVFTSERESDIVRDGLFSVGVARTHRKRKIDTIFINPNTSHPLLRDYCGANETGNPIEIQDIVRADYPTAIHYFAQISEYSKQNPLKNNLAFVSEERQKDLGELTDLFQTANFQVTESLCRRS